MLSRFTQHYHDRRDVVVYHSLQPELLHLDTEQWLSVVENPDSHQGTDLYHKLCELKLLVTTGAEDQKQLAIARDRLASNLTKSPSILYLVLTEECNLACRYCPYSERPTPHSVPNGMTIEEARDGIKEWAALLRSSSKPGDEPTIIFYGGEPFLNCNVLLEAIRYARSLESRGEFPGGPLKLTLISNGVLMTAELAQFLAYQGVEVTIAIDAFSGTNDIYRLDMNNKGTLNSALAALEMLRESNTTTYLSTTLTPENLQEIIRFDRFIEKYRINGIGINMPRGIPPAAFGFQGSHELQSFQREAASVAAEFYWYGQANGFIEFQADQRVRAFTTGALHPVACGGYGGYLTLYPGGRVASCPWTLDLGDSDQGSVPDLYHSLREHFLASYQSKLPLYNETCLSCEAISICGGPCIWADNQARRESEEGEQSHCSLTKLMFNTIVRKHTVSLGD